MAGSPGLALLTAREGGLEPACGQGPWEDESGSVGYSGVSALAVRYPTLGMVWMMLGLAVFGRSRPTVTATLLVNGSAFSSHT